MESDVLLPILPTRGLDQSILLAVLVGMGLLLFLTESLGWVFVGVVVPGYLASVFVIQPVTGLVIAFESIVTYAIARFSASVLSRTGAWTEFFGRDRFFLIVLVSVVVRQHDQSWLLPSLAEQLDAWAGTTTRLDRNFFSIGLVLVPLTANMFWKLGLRRGLTQAVVVVGTTYVVLRVLLLPYTNLTYSGFELTYENTAIDFLGNPKAYIILLSTALAAGHLNLRYGWDYNGILVPALLALLWPTPTKLAVTIAEALGLALLTRRVVRLPGIRGLNLEGPRRVAVAFSVAFSTKAVVGFVLEDRFPGVKLSDLFGFGYLLPTLLAVKILDKRSARMVLLPAALTSFTGFVGGSLIGFVVGLWFPPKPAAESRADLVERPSERLRRTELGVVVLGRMRALQDRPRGVPHADLVGYGELWAELARWNRGGQATSLAPQPLGLVGAAARLGLVLAPLSSEPGETRVALVEREAGGKQGAVVTSLDTAIFYARARGPWIEVPSPVGEAPSAEFAVDLCARLECRGIVVAGPQASVDSVTSDAVEAPRTMTPFEVVHAAIEADGVVSLRLDEGVPRGRTVLHLERGLPETLRVEKLGPQVLLEWTPPVPVPSQWGRGTPFAVIRVHPLDAASHLEEKGRRELHSEEPDALYLPLDRDLAAPGESRTASPSWAEDTLLHTLVVAPLLRQTTGRAAPLDRLWPLHAHVLGLQASRVEPCLEVERCWRLHDPSAAFGGLGEVLVRDGPAVPISVEVPHPRREFGTHRLGFELFAEGRARVLIVAGGDDPRTPDAENPTRYGNIRSAFQALHEGVDAGAERRAVDLVLAVRGFSREHGTASDVVVGLGRPLLDAVHVPPRLAALFTEGGPLGFIRTHAYSDGSGALHGLSGAGVPQVEHAIELGDKDVAVLWFADHIRQRYRVRAQRSLVEALARVIEFQGPRSEFERLLGKANAGATALKAPLGSHPPARRGLDRTSLELREVDALVSLAERVSRTWNVHLLRDLRDRVVRAGGEIAGFEGTQSGRLFLWFVVRGGGLLHTVGVAMDQEIAETVRLERGAADEKDRLRTALFRRVRTIRVEGPPLEQDVAGPARRAEGRARARKSKKVRGGAS